MIIFPGSPRRHAEGQRGAQRERERERGAEREERETLREKAVGTWGPRWRRRKGVK